jgi:protein involved in polysaccharide export with SLBB domain
MKSVAARSSSTLGAAGAAVLLLLALSGCTSAGTPIPEIAKEINATRQQGPMRFVPGDRISIRFASNPTLDQRLDIRPDGTASFLMVGELPVAGKTPAELTQELTQAYTGKLTTPDLSANLDSSVEATEHESSRRFFVLGEVTYAGSFNYTGEEITIPKAIALAHGFEKTSAALKAMLLVRWLPKENGYHGWKIDAEPEFWGSPDQIFLQAGDVLYVPNTTIDKVDIWVDKYIRQLIPFPYLSYYVVNQPATPTN